MGANKWLGQTIGLNHLTSGPFAPNARNYGITMIKIEIKQLLEIAEKEKEVNIIDLFRLEPGRIKSFSIDSKEIYFDYSKNSESFNDWPYDNPFFLIINLAIGGEWGGIQGIDNSIFPASFVIDYVRLYIKE